MERTHLCALHLVCPKGFEPPTHGLEGRCSIQLSYGHRIVVRVTSKISKNLAGIHTSLGKTSASALHKAGDGNRTHVSSLEGWCSTIELHPRVIFELIGVTGFEPATPCSQSRCSSQAEPHPVLQLNSLSRNAKIII